MPGRNARPDSAVGRRRPGSLDRTARHERPASRRSRHATQLAAGFGKVRVIASGIAAIADLLQGKMTA
jgi:hypothetical protein